jgi:hypothetical protein
MVMLLLSNLLSFAWMHDRDIRCNKYFAPVIVMVSPICKKRWMWSGLAISSVVPSGPIRPNRAFWGSKRLTALWRFLLIQHLFVEFGIGLLAEAVQHPQPDSV